MFDHVINYASEFAATTEPALAIYYDPASGEWRDDVVIPGVQVYRIAGYETLLDPVTGEYYESEIRQDYPGWFALFGLPDISDEIRNLPLGCCLLITDREAALAGQPALVFASSTLTQEDLDMLHVEPNYVGSAYNLAPRDPV